MRLRHHLPLVLFVIAAATGTFVLLGSDGRVLAGFGSFLVGFAITYVACVRQALRNSYAIVRLGARTPFVLPFVFFSVPTLSFGLLTLPRSPGPLLSFLAMYATSALVYVWGAVIVYRELAAREPSANDGRSGADLSVPDGRPTLVLVNPINPARTGLTVNRSSRFPPLGLAMVAALTPDRYRVVLMDEVVKPFHLEEADLVGITAFTSSVTRAYEIAALYRQRGVPVVLGGIHASMCPDEALQYVDAVVVGEAEGVWPEVLRDFEAGKLQRVYRGSNGDLANLPVPRRELLSPEYGFATVQTSRGCPMDCPFCSVTALNGRTYRQRPVQEVLDELAGVDQPFVFFVDDNLLGHGRAAEARAIALFRGMVERNLQKSWYCQASIDIARNDEVLYWAARSGCKMVFIGLESGSDDELRAMGKKLNLRTSYEEVFRRIHRHGIAVIGAFIFGSDAESPETMAQKASFMLRAPVDVLQSTVLTPLPGTRLFEQFRAEGRLLHEPGPAAWPAFDMTELTFRPQRMSAEAFCRAFAEQGRRLYSPWALAWKFLQTLFTTGKLETALWALASNRVYRNVARSPLAQRT